MFPKLNLSKKKQDTVAFEDMPAVKNEPTEVLGQDVSLTKNRIYNGVPGFKDMIAPPAFDRSNPDCCRLG